jgi:tyrosine-protein kinase Etk/Wzc
MVENISATTLLSKLIKWRKQLLIYTIVAAILSGLVSFLMPKQYKSTVVVFPARHFSTSKLLLEQNTGNQEDYMQLGDEDDAEKLIQVLNSDALKLKVAKVFDLYKRWKIKDTTFAYHYLKLKWEEMVSIKRTEFNSIKIEVYDYTANNSAQLANGISDYSDTVRNEMTRSVSGQALKIVKEAYDNTLTMMRQLEDSLQTLRQLGVLDYKSDVEAYTKSYAKAIEKGNKTAILELEKKLDILKKYGGAYLYINENLKKYRFKYPVLKAKYDDELMNYKENLPFKFVVEKARPNEYKAKPKRLVIIGLSSISAFILTFLILLFKENLPNLNLKTK